CLSACIPKLSRLCRKNALRGRIQARRASEGVKSVVHPPRLRVGLVFFLQRRLRLGTRSEPQAPPASSEAEPRGQCVTRRSLVTRGIISSEGRTGLSVLLLVTWSNLKKPPQRALFS